MFSLWLVSELIPALTIAGDWRALALAGLSLAILNALIAPLLRILFIPVNLITFGLFSWFVHVIVLYLLTIVVPAVHIVAWTFPGASLFGFVIPKIAFSSFASFILVSLSVSFLVNLLRDISQD